MVKRICLAKRGIRNAAGVLRFKNKAAVDARTKTIEKMLGHGRPERRIQLRTVRIKDVVAGDAAVVEADLELGAGDETLVVVEIVSIRIVFRVGPPLPNGVGWGVVVRSSCMLPVRTGSITSGVGPLPLVVCERPPEPVAAPPTAVDVPPGPPPS